LIRGTFEGIFTLADVRKIPVEQRDKVTVGQAMNRNLAVIGADEEASTAMKKVMAKQGVDRVLVSENNSLIGIVSRVDLARAIQLCPGWA
jgi:predicted transcriptional regulator